MWRLLKHWFQLRKEFVSLKTETGFNTNQLPSYFNNINNLYLEINLWIVVLMEKFIILCFISLLELIFDWFPFEYTFLSWSPDKYLFGKNKANTLLYSD